MALDNICLDKLATAFVGAGICGFTSIGFGVPQGILESASALLGIGLSARTKHKKETTQIINAVTEAIKSETEAWSSETRSSSRDSDAIASAFASVNEVIPHCFPKPAEMVVLRRNSVKMANAMLARAQCERFGKKFTVESDGRNELARTLFYRVAERGFRRLGELPDFAESLAPALRDAVFENTEELIELVKDAEQLLIDLQCQMATAFDAAQADRDDKHQDMKDYLARFLPDNAERDSRIESLLKLILAREIPEGMVPKIIDEAVRRIETMRAQLNAASNDLSALRMGLRKQAEAALKIYDLDTAEKAYREFRDVGRTERDDRRAQDARADAAETGNIAGLHAAQLQYRSAAELFAEAAVVIASVDVKEHWNFLDSELHMLSRAGKEFGDLSALEAQISKSREMMRTFIRSDDNALILKSELNYGLALLELSEVDGDTKKLGDAISIFEKLRDTEHFETDNYFKAKCVNNLGVALLRLGDIAEPAEDYFNRSVASFELLFSLLDQDDDNPDLASGKGNYGNALFSLAIRGDKSQTIPRLEKSMAAHLEAFAFRSSAKDSYGCAETHHNMAIVSNAIGLETGNLSYFKAASQMCDQCQIVWTEKYTPMLWGKSMECKALANFHAFQLNARMERCMDAYTAFDASLRAPCSSEEQCKRLYGLGISAAILAKSTQSAETAKAALDAIDKFETQFPDYREMMQQLGDFRISVSGLLGR